MQRVAGAVGKLAYWRWRHIVDVSREIRVLRLRSAMDHVVIILPSSEQAALRSRLMWCKKSRRRLETFQNTQSGSSWDGSLALAEAVDWVLTRRPPLSPLSSERSGVEDVEILLSRGCRWG